MAWAPEGLSRDSGEEARETESIGHSPCPVKVGGLEHLVIALGVGPGSHLPRVRGPGPYKVEL